MPYKTTDLCDDYSGILQIAEPIFGDFGGITSFSGAIATVKTFEDNSLVREMLESAGDGRVLVVDGGGSMRCALLGDNLAQFAMDNGWRGVVVNGCTRDAEDIGDTPLGVKALDTHPPKSVKRDYGQTDVAVTFAGITFTPGHYLYADLDGLVVSPEELNAN